MRSIFAALVVSALFLLLFTSNADSQGKKKGFPAQALSDVKDAFGDRLPVGAVARIGTVRFRMSTRHGNFQPVMSPDGKFLALPGFADDVDIMEIPAWTKVRSIRGRDFEKKNSPYFQSVVFSDDAKKVVASDANTGQLYLIDVATGKAVKKFSVPNFKGRSGMPFMYLSRDEKTLVSGARNDRAKGPVHEVLVFDVETGKLRHTIEVPVNNLDGRQTNPTISADGRWLALVTTHQNPNMRGDRLDTHLEFWDLSTGKSTRKIELDMPMVHTAISPDGKWLAASNGQSTLRFYDAADGKEVHNIRLRRVPVSHLVFAPDSATLYVADHNGTVARFNPVRGERLSETKTPVPMASVQKIGFGADGKVVAMSNYIEAIHVWDVNTGKAMSPTGVPAGMIDSLVFSPKGELFVSSEDGHAAWWDPRTATKLRDLKLDAVEAAPFNEIFLDGPAMMRMSVPAMRRDLGGMLTMSDDGSFVMSGDGGMLGVYDVKTGKLLYEDDSRNHGRVGNSCFLDGGQKIASLLNKKVRIWDTRSGRDVFTFDMPLRQQEFPTRMAAAPNGKYFVFGTSNEQGQGRVLVWDVDKKEMAREWNTQDRADAMQFSPDNEWLAVTANRDTVRLLRIARSRGDYALALGKRVDEVTQIAFAPDSRQVACATIVPLPNFDSGKIIIFEVASKKPRLELTGHYAGIIDRLAFSHDGALLASGATDSTALVWRVGLRAHLPAKADKDAPPEELEENFKELTSLDAKAAFQRMIKLVQTPAQTVKLLGAKIAPAEKVTSGDKTIPQWINDLASTQFQVRNRANATLMKIGASVEPDLKAALATAKDVETKRRIEALLEHFAAHEWTPDEVRQARAIEIVEAIGSGDARAALTRWASGDSGAMLTSQARIALTRMQR